MELEAKFIFDTVKNHAYGYGTVLYSTYCRMQFYNFSLHFVEKHMIFKHFCTAN